MPGSDYCKPQHMNLNVSDEGEKMRFLKVNRTVGTRYQPDNRQSKADRRDE